MILFSQKLNDFELVENGAYAMQTHLSLFSKRNYPRKKAILSMNFLIPLVSLMDWLILNG